MKAKDPIISELARVRHERRVYQHEIIARSPGLTSLPLYERGKAEPTLGRLRLWAQALGFGIALVPLDNPALFPHEVSDVENSQA